ncbi:hypothetical protein DM860_005323 [Cuscuta australis]|uniref:Aminotransferase-like plant mobile domain-containing protein n=1 Tax=Cuscuta australis TaxID=267555 RepID=A0A328DZ59_9ASTE|nr:hypothetical protein DM860_005323 [Cuscuta australis]
MGAPMQVQPNAGWTNREVEQYTARVIYGYLAGLLFPDSSGRFAPTDFVSYLGDFDTIANFSWGSAVLARLFSGLCRASLRVNNACPCGCMLLLQLWAWAQITTICPDVHSLPRHRHDDYVPGSAKWRMSKEYSRTARQNVRYFRDQFDGLLERHGYLLYRSYIEPVMPLRFARQFGRLQEVPDLPYAYVPSHHKSSGTLSMNIVNECARLWNENRFLFVAINHMTEVTEQNNVGENLGMGYRDWFAAV